MTLTQLQYFCAVCRYHSITRAASELFVSQPTISVAIRDLENEFHISLFHHEKNKITLTPEGEALFKKAQDLLNQSNALKLEFTSVSASKKPIRVGIPPLMSTVFFPNILEGFHSKHNIPITLYEYGSIRACNLIDSDSLDVAIVNLDFYNIDKYNYHVILEDTYVLCVHRNHIFAKRDVISIDELDNEPLIYYNTDSVQNQTIGDRFSAQNLSPNIIMHSSQLITILNTLKNDKCSAFLYSSIPVDNEAFVKIPITPTITNRFGIIWKKGTFMNEKVSTFINYINQVS